jgi:hypothetical protein
MRLKESITAAHVQYCDMIQSECRKFSIYFEGDHEVMDILEATFAAFNGGSGRECPEFLNGKVRSLSVGDFVFVNGTPYKCMNQGWEEVSWEDVYGEDYTNRKNVENFLDTFK